MAPSHVPTLAPDPGGSPAPSDDGVTAGEPQPSPSLAPSPTASPSPTSPPAPSVAAAEPEPFAMNLYEKGDFVAQYTFEWCVGASLQMTLNMATDDSRTSRADQELLWEMARDRSFSPFGGANPRGWTAALNDLGVGPYELVSLATFDEAVELGGRVASGDEPAGRPRDVARSPRLGDERLRVDRRPRAFEEFDVTGIRVHDPLYPDGSSVWGKSPKPNSLVSPATLAKQYVLRDSTRVNLGVPPGFLLVLPVAAGA